MQTFSVKNWNEFQHYKDRNPPWIKLHNHLLDDYEFEMLSDAAKGHLLCIWMLASRTKNEMPLDERWVTKKIGASSKVNLTALIEAGFLVAEQDASNMLHNEGQSATEYVPSEEERRDRVEERQSKEESSASLDHSLLGLSEVDLSELKRIRKKNKGGSLSQRVINGLAKEFGIARSMGMTDDQILTEWETRGWKSFKAEWVKPVGQAKSTHSFEQQNYTSGSF